MIDALVFDAYGTLFDVQSLASQCDALWPGQGASVGRVWRSRQLEYSWLRTLMRNYVEFETLTAEALQWTCESLGLSCGAKQVDQLLGAYRNLPVFPDALATLRGAADRKRAILSNGSPAMLQALMQNSGLEGLVDVILSVDTLRLYKPDPRVYQLAVDALHVEASQIGFVSGNGWDIAGAGSFGLRTYWINRAGAPRERLGTQPDHELPALGDLLRLLH